MRSQPQNRGRYRKPEAEPSEVQVREIEVATNLLFKNLKEGHDKSLRSRPEYTLSINIQVAIMFKATEITYNQKGVTGGRDNILRS